MDEIVKMLIGVSPLAAVIWYIYNREYNDRKAERAEMKAERDQAQRERIASLQVLIDIKNRIEDLEMAITGKRSDTHAKRPPELDALIESLNPVK